MIHAAEAKNAMNIMQKGYQDARAMQGENGGFKLWSHSDSSEGIWLTAYVAQLLGDASEFISIDEKFYTKSLEYLKKRVNVSGFIEDNGNNPRLVQGSPLYRKYYLTAFVMIATAKFKINDEFGFINIDGVNFLSSVQLPNDYEKATVAYAFALSDEEEKAKKILATLQWKFEEARSHEVKALQVEIASYVTLASLKIKDLGSAMRAFKWLVRQRRSNGGFISTHDTVLGVQAIAAMQESMYLFSPTPLPQMIVKITPKKSETIGGQIDSKFVYLSPNLPATTVTAQGNGSAYLNIFYQYKTLSNVNKEMDVFISRIEETGNSMRLTLSLKSTKVTNMAVVEVELPSGFEYSRGEFSKHVKVRFSFHIFSKITSLLIFLRKF